MYTPAHFAADATAAHDLLAHALAADLVTTTANGLVATFLPYVWAPEVGEHGALHAHLARPNDQWRRSIPTESLAIVHGSDAYVSPSWYATKAEHGRVVPTWNYVTAHVYGRLVVHDDEVWLADHIRRLTARHEEEREHAWVVEDAPEAFVRGQLRAIVGIELVITRLEAKAKLSQNRSAADRAGVAAGLEQDGDRVMAAAVRDARPTGH